MLLESVWLSPVDVLSGERHVVVQQPSSSEPHTIVTANQTGDYWIYIPLAVSVGHRLEAVRVCYRVENKARASSSAIMQVRVAEAFPDGVFAVRRDELVDLKSTNTSCHVTQVEMIVTGGVRLELRVRFADLKDRLVLIAFGIDTLNANASTPGIFNVRNFGAVGDGTTSDTDAFRQALKAIAAFSGRDAGDRRTQAAILMVPTGVYRLTEPLLLSHPLVVQGAGTAGTRLLFPAGSGGIIVDRRHSGAAEDSDGPWVTDAGASIIRDLGVMTPESFDPKITGRLPPAPLDDDAAPAETASGIVLHVRARLVNCFVTGFRHDGIHINTSHGFGANANNWYVEHCWLQSNGRHGMFVSGGDANAGVAIGVLSMENVRWGFYDRSYLGNTYIGCSAESNGHLGPTELDPRPGFGGAYRTTDGNARNVLVGCYTETNQISLIRHPTMIVGGMIQGKGVEIDPNSYHLPVRVFNEDQIHIQDLAVYGTLTTSVTHMTTISTGDAQDITPTVHVVLATPGPLALELRLPLPTAIRTGHRIIVKKIDDTPSPVVLTPTGRDGPVPPIEGQSSYALAAPRAHIEVIFAGDAWHVIGA